MGYIFISYSSKNKIAADHFKRILTQNGIQSWMAPGDIPLARKYAEVINQAIRDCSGLMLLLSEPAQNSVWVAKEVERAISYHKPLLPVMLEEVTLNDEFELYISNEQGIMVNQLDENSPEIQKILSILREIVKADGGCVHYLRDQSPGGKTRQ